MSCVVSSETLQSSAMSQNMKHTKNPATTEFSARTTECCTSCHWTNATQVWRGHGKGIPWTGGKLQAKHHQMTTSDQASVKALRPDNAKGAIRVHKTCTEMPEFKFSWRLPSVASRGPGGTGVHILKIPWDPGALESKICACFKSTLVCYCSVSF